MSQLTAIEISLWFVRFVSVSAKKSFDEITIYIQIIIKYGDIFFVYREY